MMPWGVIAALVAFVVVSLGTSNAHMTDSQQEDDSILGATGAASLADEGCRQRRAVTERVGWADGLMGFPPAMNAASLAALSPPPLAGAGCDLAVRLALAAQATVAELETGKRTETPTDIARRLVRELGVTMDYLVGMYLACTLGASAYVGRVWMRARCAARQVLLAHS